MLFITNRTLDGDKDTPPDVLGGEGRRQVKFADDADPQISVYFCEHEGGKHYEIGSKAFLDRMRTEGGGTQQVLLYIHGFNNQPPDIFKRALALEKAIKVKSNQLVQVVPLIWPCANKPGVIRDYFDDQDSADASAIAFLRAFGFFTKWQKDQQEKAPDDPCLRRINVLAHSMGNRVLTRAMHEWRSSRGAAPQIFRNVFMMAADVVNHALEPGEIGQATVESARNVSVYFASDDIALRASKVANVNNKVVSRRLGHTGPESMEDVADNVYAIDCDDFNVAADKPKGHSYFLHKSVVKHMIHSIDKGRVHVGPGGRRLTLPKSFSIDTAPR